MDATEGLVRGTEAEDTVRQYPCLLARKHLAIINVIGEVIDEGKPIKAKKNYAIHRAAPEYVDQSTESEILVTGLR